LQSSTGGTFAIPRFGIGDKRSAWTGSANPSSNRRVHEAPRARPTYLVRSFPKSYNLINCCMIQLAESHDNGRRSLVPRTSKSLCFRQPFETWTKVAGNDYRVRDVSLSHAFADGTSDANERIDLIRMSVRRASAK
jgi:hypothetical protein